MAYVEHHFSDRVHLMVGEREIVVHDRDLAARILNAAGGQLTCRPTAKHPRSARTRSPTAPTSTRSSAPTGPQYVTLIANFIPMQAPDGGPNFYEFGDDVLYEIHVNNRGDATRDVSFQFKFSHEGPQREDLPLQHRPDHHDRQPELEPAAVLHAHPDRLEGRQGAQGGRARQGSARPAGATSAPRSTPDYAKLSAQAVHDVKQGIKVFCGQRADAFHVDLGSIFDLGALRPLNEAHLISMPNMNGVNSVQSFNVHTIALEIPIKKLTRDGSVPTNPLSKKAVIGVWATASRRKSQIWDKAKGKYVGHGPWEQVSRLANPLFNEVIVPMAEKDEWNARPPWDDKRYAKYVNKPELQGLLPVLYPGAFPNLAKYTKPRADLNAVLLTGIPEGVVPGFQNYTGAVEADMLRLNMAIPPTAQPNDLGLVAGDAAGLGSCPRC